MKDENKPDWYTSNYNRINSTAIPHSLPNRVLHKFLESGLTSKRYSKILEIGANNGEHFDFVIHDYEEYTATDLKVTDVLIGKSRLSNKLILAKADAHNLPFEDSSFDRVLSTCVFHHLENPELALKECLRVTKPGGLISILLPNDPGVMYRFARRLTTVREAKKIGMKEVVEYIHAKEHRNHYLGILCLAKEVFKADSLKINAFPFVFPNYNLNLITRIAVIKKS